MISLAVFIHAIGTIPLFASRAFLPAFLTALLFRYPNQLPFVEVSVKYCQSEETHFIITSPPYKWKIEGDEFFCNEEK